MMFDLESFLRQEAEDLLLEIEGSIREGVFEMGTEEKLCQYAEEIQQSSPFLGPEDRIAVHVLNELLLHHSVANCYEALKGRLRTEKDFEKRIVIRRFLNYINGLVVEEPEVEDIEDVMERQRLHWEDRRAIERDCIQLY